MNSAAKKTSAAAAASAIALTALVLTQPACSKETAKTESTCSGAQALTKTGLTGASMKLKELSLTFDDGPGMRTIELSHYLKEQGIRATFFVWGQAVKNDGSSSNILQTLVDDGHLVANHTEHHYSLTQHAPQPLNDEQIVAEFAEVDALIAPVVKNDIWLFRPPYGHWSDGVVAAVDKTPMKKYVGPILWNVGGTMGPSSAADTECWKPATLKSVTECGDLYIKEIETVGKGIVLLHDPYFIDMQNPESGGTYQMVQYIVPILKSKGYSFKRVDEVPDIAKLLPNAPKGADAGAPTVPGTSGDGTGDGTGDDTGTNPCP